MDGTVRKFVTINTDHTPWGTSVMARATITIFATAVIPVADSLGDSTVTSPSHFLPTRESA